MSKLDDVNTTDIREAIRLGCRTMQSVFNADDVNVPFGGSVVRPRMATRFGALGEAHITGRHLNALLNAEDAAGIELCEAAVDNHRRAAYLSYSGPLALPLNRKEVGGPLVDFCPHDLREGFHALCALTRFRGDARARQLMEQSIATVFELWSPDRGWHVERFEELGLNYQGWGFIHGVARMVGSLVKCYRATGYGPALELALILKEKAIDEFYLADGQYDPERFVTRHGHSITCVLSSLAQLADLLGDASLLMRVKAFYDHGLWDMRDQIGWSPEVTDQEDTDHGESNNTGDILETALILGRCGPSFYANDRPVLWTEGRLLRAVHLYRPVSFYED